MAGSEAHLDPKSTMRSGRFPCSRDASYIIAPPAHTNGPPQPGVSLAKPTTRFVCQSCGAVTPKWAGRCETCLEWNTIEPETIAPRPGAAAKAPAGQTVNFVGLRGEVAPPPRAATGIDELDRVLGGGLVPASAV